MNLLIVSSLTSEESLVFPEIHDRKNMTKLAIIVTPEVGNTRLNFLIWDERNYFFT